MHIKYIFKIWNKYSKLFYKCIKNKKLNKANWKYFNQIK